MRNISIRTTQMNYLAYTLQNTPNLDKPIPLKSVVLRRNIKAVRFSNQL